MAYYVPPILTEQPKLSYLPKELKLPKVDKTIILDNYKDSDYDTVYAMLKEVVEEGQTYPQLTMNPEHFENYYLSHHVFVARDPISSKAIGSFYVKPNYPGRSSHICNAGFLVSSKHRGKGIGHVLMYNYLRIAKDLGYKASFFNLVYKSNHASLTLCKKLGFTQIGIVPKAGNLKGLGYTDAVQFYYDLTTLDESKKSE